MPETVTLDRIAADDAADMVAKLRAAFEEVYREPPYSMDQADSEEFVARFARQVGRPGFALVTATVDCDLAGFSYGYIFESGIWWRGAVQEPPPEIKAASKFAVIELVLRRLYRGLGLGRRMMDELLQDRPEEYAILLASPDAPAREIYRRWGWQQVGTVQSYPHWTPDDALVLPLRSAGT